MEKANFQFAFFIFLLTFRSLHSSIYRGTNTKYKETGVFIQNFKGGGAVVLVGVAVFLLVDSHFSNPGRSSDAWLGRGGRRGRYSLSWLRPWCRGRDQRAARVPSAGGGQ